MYSGGAAQPCVEIGYAGGDVVADQPHALDPVNPALGGFIGVPDLEAGSGNVLHASRPSVTTTSTSRTSRGSISLGVWSVMSTPISLSASADSVLTAVPGLVPAEYICTVSPAICRISPAAIWDLPADAHE